MDLSFQVIQIPGQEVLESRSFQIQTAQMDYAPDKMGQLNFQRAQMDYANDKMGQLNLLNFNKMGTKGE